MNLNESGRSFRWIPPLILALLSILFIALDRSSGLSNLFAFVSNPAATLLEWSAVRTDTLADALSGPQDLQAAQAEIAQLEAEIEALRRENQQLAEIQGEYQILTELLGRANEAPTFSRVSAEVIGRGPNTLKQDLIINRGSADGIRVGMPVESAQGLVGQVVQTTPNSAQLLLVNDVASNIPARLAQSRATGILVGDGSTGLMTLDWVSLEAQLQVGEVVVTSGIEGITPEEQVANRFPRDVVIGRIVSVDRNEAELFQQATVQPAVDFNDLETVFVITDFVPVNISIFGDEN